MISLLSTGSGGFSKTRRDSTLIASSKKLNHIHTGDNEMNGIISRLSELSEALQVVELYPEAKLVQDHISRLTSDKYNQIARKGGIDSILSEFVNDF